MKKPYNDFFSAFYWLRTHPAMWHWGEFATKTFKSGCYEPAFPHNLDVDVVKVHPKTLSVCKDESKNTRTRIWIEVATYTAKDRYQVELHQPDLLSGFSRHDYPLDCGGDTFEEAIIALADKVWRHYGAYGRPKCNVWGKPNRIMKVPKWYPRYAKEDRKAYCRL